MADCCCSPLGPSGSGGTFAPIQNVRYLDDTFVGTSDGSIARPFTLFSEFYSELTAASDGWLLTLPGRSVTPDANLPDVTTLGSVAFEGLDRRYSQISDLTVEDQTGNPSLIFRQLNVPNTLTIGDGTLLLDFDNVDVRSVVASGASLFGVARILDSHFLFALLGSGVGIEMHGGDVTTVSFGTGHFYDVQFGNGGTLTPGAGTTYFVGCSFGTGITISNASAPTLVMDQFSYASFIANTVVFLGTVRVLGTTGFMADWGTAAAPGTPARFIPRTNGAVTTTTPACEYPVLLTGTFLWRLSWRVSGTQLAVDSVAVTMMRNNAATALVATIPVSTLSGTASAILAASQGDGICLRLLQSASEAASAWNGNFSLRATLIG